MFSRVPAPCICFSTRLAELPGLRDLPEWKIQGHGFVDDITGSLQLGISRDQVVLAIHLDSVAGVVKNRHVSVARPIAEIAQGRRKLAIRDVVLLIDIEP